MGGHKRVRLWTLLLLLLLLLMLMLILFVVFVCLFGWLVVFLWFAQFPAQDAATLITSHINYSLVG